MQILFIAMLLGVDPAAVSPATPIAYTSADRAAEAIAADLQTGCLLFSEGECLAVRTFTGSPYTHVAVVVAPAGHPKWVYDSQNGIGVRKSLLADYLALVKSDVITVLTPAHPFTDEEADALVASLEDSLGRPYSVVHHLTGHRVEGRHCAEYATDALMAAGRITAQNPPKVSPASLRNGLLRHDLYAQNEAVVVLIPTPEREPGRNWCEELWFDTKDCCRNCWSQFRGCVLCRG